jgi:adenylate cyclase
MPAVADTIGALEARLRAANARFAELVRLGTAGHSPVVRRRLMIMNMMAYLIALFSAVYAVLFAVYDFSTYSQMVWVNLVLVALALVIPSVHRYDETAAGYIIAAVEFFALFFFVRTLGRDSGIGLNFVIAAAAPFVIFGLERWRQVAAVVVIGLVLHVASWFLYPPEHAVVPADPALLSNLYVNSAITTFAMIAVIVNYAFNLANRAEAETDRLLKIVVPAPIAERLKAAPGTAISDSVASASVLFADLVGFTPLTRRLGASDTVVILNEFVSELDCLAAKYGVEKIKTIGDSFMAVAGAPEPQADHARRLTAMALEVRDVVCLLAARRGLDIGVRIGIASGPLTAGVIGTTRFTYDVWGDTVNLAARLEQTGARGCVHICDDTKRALEGAYSFERRDLDIRGFGAMETWFMEKLPATKDAESSA